MGNKGEKIKKKVTNSTKWIIFVATFIIVLIASLIFYLVTNQRATTEANSKDVAQENNIEETVTLESLTEVANKTEEELKEINEKELEEAKKKEENKTTTTQKKNKYYIKVNYGAQVVNVYTYDENGKYTVPVKAFVCSTGTYTPKSGVYKIPAKIEWCFMYGDVYAHYCTQIVGDILFHSVPYLKKSNDTLEYWEYDKLGTRCSMGCIRLTTRDAKWIYDNVSYGTQVEFYSSSDPGPLGKPSAQKISDAPGNLKWWDPTDPDSRNPWKTYKPSDDTSKNEQNTVENNTEAGTTGENNEVSSGTGITGGNNEASSGTGTTDGNNEAGSGTGTTDGNNEAGSGTGTTDGNNEAGSGGTGTTGGNNETGNGTGTTSGNNEAGSGGTGTTGGNNEAGSGGTGTTGENNETNNGEGNQDDDNYTGATS